MRRFRQKEGSVFDLKRTPTMKLNTHWVHPGFVNKSHSFFDRQSNVKHVLP